MHAVYAYYNVPGRHGMARLLGDALILAKAKGADVFNCLDLQVRRARCCCSWGGGRSNVSWHLYRPPWCAQENLPVLRDLSSAPATAASSTTSTTGSAPVESRTSASCCCEAGAAASCLVLL